MTKLELLIDEDIEILKNTTNRLNYIFSEYDFDYSKGKITITGKNIVEAKLKKEVYYHLYKEKIYKDNLSIRKKIYDSI